MSKSLYRAYEKHPPDWIYCLQHGPCHIQVWKDFSLETLVFSVNRVREAPVLGSSFLGASDVIMPVDASRCLRSRLGNSHPILGRESLQGIPSDEELCLAKWMGDYLNQSLSSRPALMTHQRPCCIDHFAIIPQPEPPFHNHLGGVS